jgi:hypothetical protein
VLSSCSNSKRMLPVLTSVLTFIALLATR